MVHSPQSAVHSFVLLNFLFLIFEESQFTYFSFMTNGLKNIYFNLFIRLCWILVSALGIFSCSIRILICSMWDLVPESRIEPGPPDLGMWSLSHQTTGEVPHSFVLKHTNAADTHAHREIKS